MPDDVSVVIPTVDRPDLLLRAVVSALGQSHPPHEVIIVQDGNSPRAVEKVRAISDDRVRIVTTGRPSNDAGATARNLGVRTASSYWVAFLDDDDEWLPAKLDLQLKLARETGHEELLVISGQAERRTSDKSVIWPSRPKRSDESLANYLFVRRYAGEGWIPTPTIMTQRATALQIPFSEGLTQHEDHDWMLRVEAAGARFKVLDQVIAIVHVVDANSLDATAAWIDSLNWASRTRYLLGPRAYSAFCLTEVSRQARRNPTPSGFIKIGLAAFRGEPRMRDLAHFGARWLLPTLVRDALEALRMRKAATAGASNTIRGRA